MKQSSRFQLSFLTTSLLFLSLTILIPVSVSAQLNSTETKQRLKQHIRILASDSLQGREAGTAGGAMAADYIVKQFKDAGLTAPKDSFVQTFSFTRHVEAGSNTSINAGKLKVKTDSLFYPLPFSGNATVKAAFIKVGFGIEAPRLNYSDYSGFTDKDLNGKIFLIECGVPDHKGPHSDYGAFSDLRSRVDLAISKHAAGVLFINTYADEDNPRADFSRRSSPVEIPVAFAAKKYSDQLNTADEIKLTTSVNRTEAKTQNIMGMIDNNAANTIVIGAHYDHLGMGGEESLYRGKPAIHNGADDNASGTAALIELARYLKANGPKGNNYLFIAFSGEEKGLLGSGYYVHHPVVALDKVNYMLNMDMVGRLKTDSATLLVNGTGTSDAWKIIMQYIQSDAFKVKSTESGVGPSDHTSFYLQNIPVLHFFSGTHTDYHKPSDDENLINYDGEVAIMNYMLTLIQKLDDKGKLTFVKTKDDNNEDAPRFKVTLGVIPDYAFEGKGMRIDGVTEGRPASKGGLLAGDVVLKIGDYNVSDMTTYMKALGGFEKGQTAPVTVLRGTEQIVKQITF